MGETSKRRGEMKDKWEEVRKQSKEGIKESIQGVDIKSR